MKTAKRITGLLLVALGLLAGCAKAEPAAFYIEKAELTESEKQIASLLGADMGSIILDFHADDQLHQISFQLYQLDGAQWEPISGGGGISIEQGEGRIAISTDTLLTTRRIAIQSKNDLTASSYSIPEEPLPEGMGRTTSYLSDRTEFTYGQEVPLIIQILTSKNEVQSYDVDTFATPQRYAEHGYEQVYALTVTFRTEKLT